MSVSLWRWPAALWALCAFGPAAGAYEPRINYMLQCMGCHTPDGSGEPGRVPSVKDTLVPFAASPDGRRFLVQVPGASQSTLSDAELAGLLNWMIQNLSRLRPEHFTSFTAAEVASYRRTPLVGVRAARATLIQRLPGASSQSAGAGGGH
jgi:mono/diheme cytochrome c family protein